MVGDRVREVRKKAGLTMKQFAEPLGLSESAISRIESGSANPSDGALRLICAVYGINYDWLLTGSGDMQAVDPDAIIEELAAQKNWDAETVDILKKMFRLPDDKFQLVMKLIESMKDEGK